MKLKSLQTFVLFLALIVSLPQSIYAQQSFLQTKADETIELGDNSSPWGSYNYPVDMYGRTSLSQSIYLQSEINHAPCVIESIEYTYKTVTTNWGHIEGEQFKIWMSNTSASSLDPADDGYWLPYESFTLVFEGTHDLEAGSDLKLKFNLDQAFIYNGGNLCIMVEHVLSANNYPNHFNFEASSLPEGVKRARLYNTNGTPDDQSFDYTQMHANPESSWQGMTLGNIADVDLYVNNPTTESLSGTVTDASTTNAVENAKVEILNTDLVSYTDNTGAYSFPVMPAGNAEVKVSKFGYVTQTSTVNINGNITQDFALELLSTASLSGKVTDKDNNPISGANIEISGYESYSAVTDDNGDFTVNDVLFADDYTIVTSAAHYLNDTTSFDVTQANTNLNNIVLSDVIRSVSLVQAEANDQNTQCNVSWLSPHEIIDYRYDGGNAWNGIGHINGEVAVFGSVFREPAKLYKASWYRYSSETNVSADSINLFVFPLDASHTPLNTPVVNTKVLSGFNTWTDFVFEDTLDLSNGFMVAISGMPSAVSMGIDDGQTADYPFIPNVNYVSENYLLDNGNFFPIEDVQPIPGNFMMRAEGYNTETGGKLKNTVSKGINKYKVYRLVEGTQNTPSEWTLLDDNVTELNYTDANWATIEDNWYRYAVSVVYSDNMEAEPVFSNLLGKGVTTNVDITVTTNTPDNNSEGAKITFINANTSETVYTGIIENETGNITVNELQKGFYHIYVELNGYTTISDINVDLSTEASYTKSYELIEALTKPENLDVTIGEDIIFYWDLTQVLFDNFESYGSFDLNPTGTVDWTYLDLDGNATTTFSGITYPNQGEPSAFMVFTPTETQPSIDLVTFPGMAPHSGDSYLMGFGLNNGTNNDFIISPELHFNAPFTFSFYAKSFSLTDLPQFKVGYSTTGNNASDFVWLTENPVSPEGGPEFFLYSYTVPKDAKYVCINNISEGEKILMLDDINIAKGSKKSGSKGFLHYNVYLDDELQGETNELSYTFENVSAGNHTAGVEAVYSTGTSEVAEFDFVITTAIKEVNAQDINLYPIPANTIVNIRGEFDAYYVYDIYGKLVLNGNAEQTQIDVSHLNSGIYTIKFINDTQSTAKQIVVKH